MTKAHVLLVEDDEFIGALVKSVLGLSGYVVTVLEDFAQVRELAEFDFAAVLTDFQLPGGDGCDVIAYLREKVPGIPAMILSGYGVWTLERVSERGLEGVQLLSKPFRAGELQHAVEALVPAQSCRE